MPKNTIIPVEVTALFAQLRTQCTNNALTAEKPGLVARQWVMPSTVGAYPLCDPRALYAAYVDVRNRLNVLYELAIRPNVATLSPDVSVKSQIGSIGELIVYKTLLDYIATQERALRASFATRVQSMQWSAARKHGHGSVDSSVFQMVLTELANLLASSTVEGT